MRAAPGGSHPGRGTRNALLSLGPRRYLEIMAPDPAQPALTWFERVAHMREPALLGWAVAATDLGTLAARLRESGFACRGPAPGMRTRADGTILRWRTVTLDDDEGGLFPFFIEWAADSLHPATDAPQGCRLTRLTAATPDAARLTALGRVTGIDFAPAPAVARELAATLDGPAGTYETGLVTG